MSTIAEKPSSGITSIKLGSRKEALASIAQRRNRSVHSLVLEAVDLYTAQQNAWVEFEEQAIRSFEQMRTTGLHTTQSEMKEWAKKLKTNPNEPLPKCHI